MFGTSANAIDRFDEILGNAEAEMQTGCLSLDTFLLLQRLWSARTFGPQSHRGPMGPLKHLKKEVEEALNSVATTVNAASPQDAADCREIQIEELADCFFLVVDAVWRSGVSPVEFRQALTTKLIKNRNRAWPDWREKDANDAIEHVRNENDVGDGI
jgi:hypothetical protein